MLQFNEVKMLTRQHFYSPMYYVRQRLQQCSKIHDRVSFGQNKNFFQSDMKKTFYMHGRIRVAHDASAMTILRLSIKPMCTADIFDLLTIIHNLSLCKRNTVIRFSTYFLCCVFKKNYIIRLNIKLETADFNKYLITDYTLDVCNTVIVIYCTYLLVIRSMCS